MCFIVSILLIKYDRHFVIDDLCYAGLMIAEFFIQIAVAFFLQDCVELPVILAVNPLRFCDCLLSVAFIAVFRHNEDRRYSFSGNTVFMIHHTDNADFFVISRYKIIGCFVLIKAK